MRVGAVAGVSDPGRRRRRNEDVFVCKPPLFAVADGVGGARAGEVASSLAAAALHEDASGNDVPSEERVASLIQEANRRVYQRSSEDNAFSGMGTTMTVALVEDGVVTIGHVGDSRAYLIRDGRLDQVTEDHSLVAELMRDGRLSPEEAETHPQRSVITRVIGSDPDVDVDTISVEVEPGDLFLLTTDGLTDMVGDDSILSIVERNRHDLERAARALVQAANRGGGDDNITVVFFEIARDDETAKTASLAPEDATALIEDDEDTLSELDEVPALEPSAPATPRRGRARRLVWAVLGVAALAAVCVGGLWALSRAHFIGVDASGHVAVYQGVPYDIVGDVRLYRAVYASPLVAAQLTQPERRRLFDHDLRGYRSALSVVKTYERSLLP